MLTFDPSDENYSFTAGVSVDYDLVFIFRLQPWQMFSVLQLMFLCDITRNVSILGNNKGMKHLFLVQLYDEK